jgi:hypothetical protein
MATFMGISPSSSRRAVFEPATFERHVAQASESPFALAH